MNQSNEPMITLTDTDTTTSNMLTPEMITQLQQLECWRRDQKWTEEVMHGLAANAGANQSRLYFAQVMYTVRQAAPERLVCFMNTYIRSLKDGVHVEDSLEYAVTFQQADLLSEILARYEGKPFWNEWSIVYNFLLNVVRGKFSHEGVLRNANVISGQVNEPVLRLRLSLVKAVASANLGKANTLNDLLNQIQEKVSIMDLNFMSSALLSRVMLEKANIFLLIEGDMTKAERHYGDVATNTATPNIMLSYAYRGIALANLSKSKELCLRMYKNAISHAEQSGLTQLHDQLTTNYYPFARNVHGEHFDTKGVVPEERVHQYVVRCETEKALRLATELEANGKGSTFLTFYRGKATGDRQTLKQAHDQFKRDHLGYMLPLVEREIMKGDGLK